MKILCKAEIVSIIGSKFSYSHNSDVLLGSSESHFSSELVNTQYIYSFVIQQCHI